MTCSEQANLAYGFFLGTDEGWAVEEADEYGSLDRSWANDDPVDSIYQALLLDDGLTPEEIERLGWTGMEAAVQERWNLKVDLFGNFERQGSAYFLMAGEEQKAEAWTAQPVDLTVPRNADINLRAALRILNITPKQRHPQWMLYPTYI
jgi:hypothetical protein